MENLKQIIRQKVIGLLAFSLIVILAIGQAPAQTLDPDVTTTDPAGYQSWSNSTAKASLGVDANAGSWQFATISGDPTQPLDDNKHVIKGAQSYLYLPGMREELQVGSVGTGATGGQFNSAPWVKPDPTTGMLVGGFVWSTTDPLNNYTVQMRMRLVGNVCQWGYWITNLNQTSQQVGFRVLEDVAFPQNEGLAAGAALNQAAPYILPGADPVYANTEWTFSAIPSEWAISYPQNPGAAAGYQPYWKVRQPLDSAEGVKTPERMVVADWMNLINYNWPYIDFPLDNSGKPKPVPIIWGNPLQTDTGVGLFFGTTTLAPGGTRVIAGEVQLNWATVAELHSIDSSTGYALSPNSVAVAGQNWVSYVPGDNPATPQTENGYYNPAVITLRVYLYNASRSQVQSGVKVTITPGIGITLYPFQSPTNITEPLPSGQQVLVQQNAGDDFSWKVSPTGDAAGLIPIKITCEFNAGTIVDTFYLNVPAIPQHSYLQGIHFTGFPFNFQNTDPNAALLSPAQVQVAEWDTVGKEYLQSTEGFGVALKPGIGYWVRLDNTAQVTLQNATPVQQNVTYRIDLTQGWNAISNPFQYAIDWDSCRFSYNAQEYPIKDAIEQEFIRPELWTWDESSAKYAQPHNPTLLNLTPEGLKPYTGYWVYANYNGPLIFYPNPFVPAMNASESGRKSRARGTLTDWRVNLVAEAGGAVDDITTFGITSEDATRVGEMMKPPPSPNGISAYFPRRGAGRESGNYAVSLQVPGVTNTWPLEISCNKKNTTVTVRWPDLTQVPPYRAIMLTDVTTGKRISMRHTAAYTYQSGAGGIRQFTITVFSTVTHLQFTQTNAISTPVGVEVTFGLTDPAEVTMQVRTTRGQMVYTRGPEQAAGGLTTWHWDGRDLHGAKLPPGLYLTEFTAITPEYVKARAIMTIIIH